MGIVYFRRFRMEVDLAQPLFPQPKLPAEYRLTPWDDRLLDAHAETKYRCFRWEMDANVFPSLSDARRLPPADDRDRPPQRLRPAGDVAARVLARRMPARPELCGTIQGVADDKVGAIQNVGITPAASRPGPGHGPAVAFAGRLPGRRHRAGLSRSHRPKQRCLPPLSSGSDSSTRRSSIRPPRLRTRRPSGRVRMRMIK